MVIDFIFNQRNFEKKIGGGITFYHTFRKALKKAGHEYIHCSSNPQADVYFICAPTMVQRGEFQLASIAQEVKNKKIVLRVDGVPEDYRNRGTGWSRLKEYANGADLIIYQSEFIKNTVGKLLKKDGVVIYNGVDKSIFNAKGSKQPKFGDPSIIYVNYRKGEQNKRVHEAIERFRYYKVDNPNATMTFVGRFPEELREWDFWMMDYERNKDWQVLPPTADRVALASMMRSCDYIAFPSFADPCPNTLIEAMSCGCKPLWVNRYGGQSEIVDKWDEIDWSSDRMCREYIEAIEKIL